ncbi:signal transduction histidine kinase [Actinoplanes tereljensis]|uniref:histidine kinase n=1 Tax=Paractinoplanes tereljensis TaxID=571912 RepID=A0A919NHY9_9ACTN|nr:histidine kinase [Actinoplanes tereljensis]GIF18404.1 hypothetical protein Ate02nite_11340 [Actinoplanes tereljensis]
MTTAAPSVLLRGLSRGQLIAFDVLLAAVVAFLGFLAAVEPPAASHPGWHEPAWVSVLVGLSLAVPVAVRRLRPAAAAWLALALTAAVTTVGVIPDYAGVAPLVMLGLVLYTVGIELDRRRSVRIVAIGLLTAAAAFGWAARQPFEVLLVVWVLGACWAIGRTIRERRAYAARSAAQATELALGEERLRIARDLHDIVAHSMSVIAVRATVADHIADANPQQMRESLQVIAETSRGALADLRRALAALRAEAVVVPAPGLADLEGLTAAARTAGLAVDLDVRGEPTVPEGVGLAVFRVVQEALTNVLKHAQATTCRIEIDIGPAEIHIEVTDNGPAKTAGAKAAEKTEERSQTGAAGHAAAGSVDQGASGTVGRAAAGSLDQGVSGVVGRAVAGFDGHQGVGGAAGRVAAGSGGRGLSGAVGGVVGGVAGQGLVGMRERVALFGGEVLAGPRGGGGWRVDVVFRYGS